MPDESISQSPEYLRRVNAALALREVPDYEAAFDQLTRAIELAPEDLSILLLLGLTHQDLDQPDEAEEKLRQAHKIGPDSSQVIQALGLLLIELEQYEEALSMLETLIEADVHDPTVSLGMATALERVGRRTEAVEVLEGAQSHFPDDPELINQLGHLFLRENKIEEAEKMLTAAIDLDANPDNLLDLAIVNIRQENYKQALTVLEQAIQISSEDDRLWRARTTCFLKLGKLQEASKAAQAALSLENEDYRNWQNLARTQYALEQYDEALGTLERGIDVSQAASDRKGLWAILYERAFTALNAFGIKRGLDVIKQDLTVLPEHRGLRHLQIDLLIDTSQFAEALNLLEEASDMGLTLEDIHWEYFHVYYGLNRPEDAWLKLPPQPDESEEFELYIQKMEMIALELYQRNYVLAAQDIFQKILDIEPARARSLNNLAFILIGDERWQEVKELLEMSLLYLEEGQEDRSMTRDVTLANLGYVYLRQQNLEEAVQILEQAEKLTVKGDEAILRIAYWLNDKFSLADEERYPKKFTEPLLAIRANLATAYYLKGGLERSLELAQSLIDSYPESAIGYCVLGCIHFSNNVAESARSAWEQALKITKSRADKAIIQTWLDKLSS